MGKDVIHVLATSKLNSIQVYEKLYQVPTINISPELISGESEPLADDPLVQASWKAQQVARFFPRDPGTTLSIVAADTTIDVGGKVRHKPGNEQVRRDIHSIDHESYIQEAICWYKDPFTVVWQNAMVHHIIGKINRAVRVNIQAEFHKGIPPEEVRQLYDPNINARIPLIEQASGGNATITASNGDRTHRVPISLALATQIIKDRVLPPQWLQDLHAGHNPNRLVTINGTRRRLVFLGLGSTPMRD